jgi:hypothetical protein
VDGWFGISDEFLNPVNIMLVRRPVLLTKSFCCFPQSLQANSWIVGL